MSLKRNILYAIVSIGLILQADTLYAQTETQETVGVPHSHALTFGGGFTNVLDTYLSPQEYTGHEIRLQYETLHATRKYGGRLHVQTLLNAHASYSENVSGTGKMYEGLLSWNLNYLYKLPLRNSKWELLFGPGLDLAGGAVYNERNSNNPAQAKVSAGLVAGGLVAYRFSLFRKQAKVRYQATLPLLGLMFSPEFGESYYEIFQLKHQGKHLHVTTPFCAPSIRQTLSLDMPLKSSTLRVGYIADIQQSRVNHLKSHVWSHAFMIGYIKEFQFLKPSILKP